MTAMKTAFAKRMNVVFAVEAAPAPIYRHAETCRHLKEAGSATTTVTVETTTATVVGTEAIAVVTRITIPSARTNQTFVYAWILHMCR